MNNPLLFRPLLTNQIKAMALLEGTTEQCSLRDLLTDLRHVAKKMNLDFDFAVEGSLEVFEIEQDYES